MFDPSYNQQNCHTCTREKVDSLQPGESCEMRKAINLCLVAALMFTLSLVTYAASGRDGRDAFTQCTQHSPSEACLSKATFFLHAELDNSAKPRKENSIEHRRVTVQNLRVHYIESGTGRTVVLIHGNAGNVEDFEGAMQLLSREYRVIAIDRPGHGSSDRPTEKEATVEYQAELLHLTLSQLGISQPILVGHSWGAALALAYALKYPDDVSAMVLLAPAAYPGNQPNGLLRAVVKTPLLGDLSLLLGRSLMGRSRLKRDLERAFFPQKVPDKYFRLASSMFLRRKQLRAYLEDEWSLNDSLKKLSKRYSDIHIPVVIVTGAEDQILSPKENAYRLHDAIPQSQLIELQEVGHEIPQTRPLSVYTALAIVSSSSTLE